MYRRLKDDSPVLRSEMSMLGEADGGTVVISRRDDIDAALRAPTLFSSEFGTGANALGNDRPLMPLQIDPPHHKKFRA